MRIWIQWDGHPSPCRLHDFPKFHGTHDPQILATTCDGHTVFQFCFFHVIRFYSLLLDLQPSSNRPDLHSPPNKLFSTQRPSNDRWVISFCSIYSTGSYVSRVWGEREKWKEFVVCCVSLSWKRTWDYIYFFSASSWSEIACSRSPSSSSPSDCPLELLLFLQLRSAWCVLVGVRQNRMEQHLQSERRDTASQTAIHVCCWTAAAGLAWPLLLSSSFTCQTTA